MSDALNATGRPIVYSLCNWGTDSTWTCKSYLAAALFARTLDD